MFRILNGFTATSNCPSIRHVFLAQEIGEHGYYVFVRMDTDGGSMVLLYKQTPVMPVPFLFAFTAYTKKGGECG